MASKLKLYLIIIISFSFVIAVVETIVNSVIYNIYTIFYVDLKGCCLFPCAWMCLFIFFLQIVCFFPKHFLVFVFSFAKKKKFDDVSNGTFQSVHELVVERGCKFMFSDLVLCVDSKILILFYFLIINSHYPKFLF